MKFNIILVLIIIAVLLIVFGYIKRDSIKNIFVGVKETPTAKHFKRELKDFGFTNEEVDNINFDEDATEKLIPKGKYYEEGDWKLFLLGERSKPEIVRLRVDQENIQKNLYPFQAGIAIELGRIGEEENLKFFNLENRIMDIFQSDETGILVAVLTIENRVKEYLLYVSDEATFDKKVAILSGEFREYTLTNFTKHSPGWDWYNVEYDAWNKYHR